MYVCTINTSSRRMCFFIAPESLHSHVSFDLPDAGWVYPRTAQCSMGSRRTQRRRGKVGWEGKGWQQTDRQWGLWWKASAVRSKGNMTREDRRRCRWLDFGSLPDFPTPKLCQCSLAQILRSCTLGYHAARFLVAPRRMSVTSLARCEIQNWWSALICVLTVAGKFALFNHQHVLTDRIKKKNLQTRPPECQYSVLLLDIE